MDTPSEGKQHVVGASLVSNRAGPNHPKDSLDPQIAVAYSNGMVRLIQLSLDATQADVSQFMELQAGSESLLESTGSLGEEKRNESEEFPARSAWETHDHREGNPLM